MKHGLKNMQNESKPKGKSDIREGVIVLESLGYRNILITSAPKDQWKKLIIATIKSEDQDVSLVERATAWTYGYDDMVVKNGQLGVLIHAWIIFDMDVYCDVIVHEVHHAVNRILDYNGVEADKKDEEIVAYLSDWLFTKIANLLDGWGRLKGITVPKNDVNVNQILKKRYE